MDIENAHATTSPQEQALPRDAVTTLLARQGEICLNESIGYYPSIHALAEKVRSSSCWTQGEVFVYAASDVKFVVMMQIAPASCEMLTITHAGYQDVLTAYRFELDELEARLNEYIKQAGADH